MFFLFVFFDSYESLIKVQKVLGTLSSSSSGHSHKLSVNAVGTFSKHFSGYIFHDIYRLTGPS